MVANGVHIIKIYSAWYHIFLMFLVGEFTKTQIKKQKVFRI